MEEWKEYKVAEVIEEISMGPFGSNIKVDNFIDFGVPVLNGSNLQGFKLNEESFQLINILQTEIFQADVVDAILVKPRHDMVAHYDNLSV